LIKYDLRKQISYFCKANQMIVSNFYKTNRVFQKQISNSNPRSIQIAKEKIKGIRQEIYIGSSQPPKLCLVLDKPPSSTNFNKLQVFVTATPSFLTQPLLQTYYNQYSLFYETITGSNTNQKDLLV